MKINQLIKLGLLGVAVAFSSCSDDKSGSLVDAELNKHETEIASLTAILLSEEPANAMDIADMRKKAASGDPVVFRGKAMGGPEIFMDKRAVMILGDPNKITSCDLNHGENCATPWDVCCDDADVIKASIVTVQITDADGKPLKTTLKGLGGIKELTNVIITGQVAKGSNEDNMIINATGIYVMPEVAKK